MKILNQLRTVLIILLCLGIFSCSKDSDESNDDVNISNLYGFWEPVHAEGWEEGYDGKRYEWNKDIDTSLDDDDNYPSFEFLEDNTCNIYTYSIDKKQWVLDDILAYFVKGNKIYIDRVPITIKNLNSSQLILEDKEDDFYEVVTLKKIN